MHFKNFNEGRGSGVLKIFFAEGRLDGKGESIFGGGGGLRVLRNSNHKFYITTLI